MASTSHGRVRKDSSSRRLERTFRMVRIRRPCGSQQADWRSSQFLLCGVCPGFDHDPFLRWLGSAPSVHQRSPSHCRTWSRWAITRRSAWIKESVLSEYAAVSMCTALLTRQVKRDSYLFMSSRPWRKPALRVRRDIGERLCAPPSRLETYFLRE